MQDIRVAAVTMPSEPVGVAKYLQKIGDWVNRAADAGAGLVVFPEAALTDYDLDVVAESAVMVDSPAVQTLAALAERRGVIVSFGFLEHAGDGYYVSQAMVGRGVRFVHRKCHRTNWELKHCRAGTSLEVQDIGPAKVGTLICYDSAFPAAAETLVRRGAEILIQPSCHGMSAKAVSVAERAAGAAAVSSRCSKVPVNWRTISLQLLGWNSGPVATRYWNMARHRPREPYHCRLGGHVAPVTDVPVRLVAVVAATARV
jgi:predicted amidohydrolase